MNAKLERVNPHAQTNQYIAGSISGNYFLIVSDSAKGIVAFRPLNQAVPAIGATPTAGTKTRVRVVPTAGSNSKLDALMERFGFGKVNGGSTPVHYSTVTSTPAKAIADADLALKLAA